MPSIRPTALLKPLLCTVAIIVASNHARAGLGDAADTTKPDAADTTKSDAAPAAKADAPAPEGDSKKGLIAAIAKDKDTKPTDTFPADIPQLYAFWISHNLENGDKVRGVWIADDVGAAAPKGTKIDESTLVFAGANENAFSLTKPNNGWPVGSYHVDIYINDGLAKTVPFTIVAAE